ncbi:DUF4395 domain-containing protein [Chloroflexia bacterium SDU3-3]|nr:DUF4395 domain-containing protein [Chloroflexia bacterium SDU3-3]
MAQTIAQRAAPTGSPLVDHTQLRFNQACIIVFVALAFILDLPWVVAAVALVLALGTAYPPLGLFQQIYRQWLRPAGLLTPDLRSEDSAPHRFAQGMGAGVLVLASVAFALGAAALGWGLGLVVVVLAAVNLFFGFCAGCFVFFQIQRLRARAS